MNLKLRRIRRSFTGCAWELELENGDVYSGAKADIIAGIEAAMKAFDVPAAETAEVNHVSLAP